MVHKMKALLVLGAFAMVAGTAQAQIATTAKCETAKVKCVVNKVKGLLNCEGKAAKLGIPTDTLCTTKVRAKFTAPGVCQAGANIGLPCTVATQAVDCPLSVCKVKACMDKADAKNATVPCLTHFDGPAMEAKVDAFVAAEKTALYVTPSPTGVNPCWAAQQKCIANLVKGNLNCESKAVKTGLPADSLCLAKAALKFTNAGTTGCMDKLNAAGKACTTSGIGNNTNTGTVFNATQAFNQDVRAELMPNSTFSITTVAGVGPCGSVDSVSGSLLSLNCGDLAIGGGASTVPPGATPPGSITKFSVLGTAGATRQIVGAPATISGSNRNCSRSGCFFGSPLPISNGPLSTCVNNTFTATASGTLTLASGSFTGAVPLQSAVTVTSNSTQPCPKCVAGSCDANSSNAGDPCTADAGTGESHDCGPIGPGLPPFAVNLSPIGTAAQNVSDPGGIFCPPNPPVGSNGQATAGAFGEPTAVSISLTGVASTSLPTYVSIFCIPSTGNVLIDGSANLPGPGADSLPLSTTLNAIP